VRKGRLAGVAYYYAVSLTNAAYSIRYHTGALAQIHCVQWLMLPGSHLLQVSVLGSRLSADHAHS
jgi:hypothetical protein